MSSTYNAKWGIMATGGIAEIFCKDLLNDPASRQESNVSHEIVAVASSTSTDRAADFIRKIGGPTTASIYGSYAGLVSDPNVDIVYVATPHSHHFQNAMLALQAGKHVLCEKAFTMTSAQAEKLAETARTKRLFLMEAMWTRFLPLSIRVQEIIKSGAIGKVYRTIADLSYNENNSDGGLLFPDSHRMVNRELAGGALLDLGVYSLSWVFQTLYNARPAEDREAPHVMAALNEYHTGIDDNAGVLCHFPKSNALGIALSSMRVGTFPLGAGTFPDEYGTGGQEHGGPSVRIQGSNGEIQIMGEAFMPSGYKVVTRDGVGEAEVVDCPIPKDPKRDWGHGMFWEADECARCLRDGRLESDIMPLQESIALIKVVETALQQGHISYPEAITSEIFDPRSPLNTGAH